MRVKVYHIEVLHGDNITPCSCSDSDIDKLVDALPEDEEVVEFVKNRVIKLCGAPVLVVAE